MQLFIQVLQIRCQPLFFFKQFMFHHPSWIFYPQEQGAVCFNTCILCYNKAPSISSPLGCPSEVEKFEKGKKMSNIFGMEMSQRLRESIFDMKFH